MKILSIGHSTLDIGSFLDALSSHGVNAIADVRSNPQSRHYPQYNQDELREVLISKGIAYVFLGKELGGRPADQSLYTDGTADYEKMALTDSFKKGISRLEEGARKYRIAMLCSERHPLDCHRCLLVGKVLSERSVSVDHIIPGITDLSQNQIEHQLLSESDIAEDDMYADAQARLRYAYRSRARRVAYAKVDRSQQKKAASG